MSKTISADEWTEVVSERHDSTVYTLEVSGEDVYAAKTSDAPPMEPEKGITLRSNESHFTPLDQSDALFLRSTSRISASVRVVPGMKAESSGRASVKADLVGTPSVDPSDRAGRVIGKVRLEDETNTLIKGSNPLPVDATVSEPPNAPGTLTDSLSGDGTLTSTSVPDGRSVLFRADPDNVATVNVDSHPLAAGQGVTLAVNNFDAVNITMSDQTDTIHAIVEDA